MHAQKQERDRGTAHSRGYTSTWAATSRAFRARYPLCGQRMDGQMHSDHSLCAQQGLMTVAECVDHIDGHNRPDDRETFNDWSRLESMCLACNSRKRATGQG
jgi:hypothetical protein